MSPNTLLVIQTLIAAGGVIASVTVSAFISGTRWGRIETELRDMRDARPGLATKQDVSAVVERLAKIEGMFTLRLRDTEGNEHH